MIAQESLANERDRAADRSHRTNGGKNSGRHPAGCWVSHLDWARTDCELVKRQLGHSSIQVTYDLYGHLFPDESDRLADALDAVWTGSDADQMRTKPPAGIVALGS